MRGTIVEEFEDVDGCELESCRGHLVRVQWYDGDTTYSCSAALQYHADDEVTMLGTEDA
jgi:hypothetical protein